MNEEFKNIDELEEDDPKSTVGVSKSIYGILGGTFLAGKKTRKLFPFIFYIAFLAILYIANTYIAERKIREMDEIRGDLKELRFEYISTKSDLMSQTKQSSITKKLINQGLKESVTPPEKLVLEEIEE
ncbi:FtsL-like putative cell division protein [Bacteroidota bacterium]